MISLKTSILCLGRVRIGKFVNGELVRWVWGEKGEEWEIGTAPDGSVRKVLDGVFCIK